MFNYICISLFLYLGGAKDNGTHKGSCAQRGHHRRERGAGDDEPEEGSAGGEEDEGRDEGGRAPAPPIKQRRDTRRSVF